MFGILAASIGWTSDSTSFVYGELVLIVDALEVSFPVLIILALTREPWPSFGIVRPRWIADTLLGGLIWLADIAVYYFVASPRSPSMLDALTTVQSTHWGGLARIPAHVLFLVACAASAFSEELVMRGYLIAQIRTSSPLHVGRRGCFHALFASYHLYQGTHGVIGAAVTGLVYGVAFCSLRRLWPVFVAHTLHNYVIYLSTGRY